MFVEETEVGLYLEVEDDLPDEGEYCVWIAIAYLCWVVVQQVDTTSLEHNQSGGQVAYVVCSL